MKALALNPKGKAAAYAVPAATIAALSAVGAYALTKNKSTTIASAVAGTLLGLAIVGYTRR